MEDVSNKTIVALLAIALVVTVVGTIVSVSKLGDMGGKYALLSGAATTGSGVTEMTISGTTSIVVTDSAGGINFGTGYVNASCTAGSAWIASDGEGSLCWLNTSGLIPAAVNDNHIVNNDGNGGIILTAAFAAINNAESFLCEADNGCQSTTAAVSIKSEVNAGDTATCVSGHQTLYTPILTNGGKNTVTLCTNMLSESTEDDLEINYNVTLPSDMPQGAKQQTVTYTGTLTS